MSPRPTSFLTPSVCFSSYKQKFVLKPVETKAGWVFCYVRPNTILTADLHCTQIKDFPPRPKNKESPNYCSMQRRVNVKVWRELMGDSPLQWVLLQSGWDKGIWRAASKKEGPSHPPGIKEAPVPGP